MNTSERHLRDELARAADEFQHAPLAIDELRGKTSHRGRMALLAAAAAVAVIAVPVAIIEYSSSNSPQPPVATSPTPSAPTTTTDAPSIGRVVIDPATAPIGTQPGMVIGIHGNLGDLPIGLKKGERLVTFAPHGTGWIVLVSNDQGELQTRILGSDGSLIGGPWPSQAWSLASSPDGSVAYLNSQGNLELDGPDGTEVQTWTMKGQPVMQPSGILPDGSVALREQGTRQQAWLANPDGTLVQVDGLLTVGGVSSDGLIAGVVSLTDGGSCGVVRSLDTGNRLWRTCQYTIGSFSPDARYVIGKPAYLDGIGDSSVSILDARTGRVIVDFTAQRRPWGYISDSVWEDGTHLLTTYYSSKSGWSVLRLGVDGSVSVTDLGDLGGSELNRPVTLPAPR